MPFVDGFCNDQPLRCQGDVVAGIHGDIAVLTKIAHGNADAGFGK